MKVLIIGSSGMLGRVLIRESKNRNHITFGLSRNNRKEYINITNDKSIEKYIRYINPQVIINSAALVNIDFCETNKYLAYLTNARAVSKIVEISNEIDAYFIQISTDHFYSGDKNKKHSELDDVKLLNEYARTKYAGEFYSLLYKKSLVIRTNILGFKNNKFNPTFIEWVISSLKRKVKMVLYSDYFISGIHVSQLATSVFDLIEKCKTGLLNVACREVYSKQKIIESIANKLNLSIENTVVGNSLKNMKVRRAESLGLDVKKAELVLKYKLPNFDDVINAIISEYYDKYAV